MSNLTVAGKVKDWCKNCKHCDTIKMVGMDTEYVCSDPYDGMENTRNGDSNVICSMYEARPNPTHVCYEQEVKTVKPGEKVDITCTKISLLQHELEMDRLRKEIHQLEKEKSNHMKGIERLKKGKDILRKALDDIAEIVEQPNNTGYNGDICFADKTVRAVEQKVTWLKNEIKNLHVLVESSLERESELEKEVKDSKEQIKQLQHEIVYLDKYKIWNGVENLELKEKNDDLNSIIEELKNENKELRSLNEKQYDMLQDMTSQISELKLKVENDKSRSELISELIKQRDSWKADYNRLNDYFLKPICEIVYGDEKADIDLCTGLIGRIKDLKVQSDENGTMYEDLKYWKERCHNAETDVTTLNSKVEVLDKRNTNQFVMIGEKDKEIEELKKKNRGLQIRVNDLLFQERLNKSTFGYDFEEENGKLRVENDKLNQTISDLTESNENLKKAVERRDRWVDELRSDIDTLQNECLTIAEIAKRAYDESIEIKEIKEENDIE